MRVRDIREEGAGEMIFWTLFLAVAGIVIAKVFDPATTPQIVGIITTVLRDYPDFHPKSKYFWIGTTILQCPIWDNWGR